MVEQAVSVEDRIAGYLEAEAGEPTPEATQEAPQEAAQAPVSEGEPEAVVEAGVEEPMQRVSPLVLS